MNLQETLKKFNITSIWHFTDESNLESIKKHGLLSLALLDKENINVSCYGANEESHHLDRCKGIDRYVHLSMTKSHPMQYVKKVNGNIPNPIWLEIDVSVLFENKSLCCDRIANARDAICYDIEKLNEKIDLFELIYGRDYRNPIKKAQLLVANRIDYSKIKGVSNG